MLLLVRMEFDGLFEPEPKNRTAEAALEEAELEFTTVPVDAPAMQIAEA